MIEDSDAVYTISGTLVSDLVFDLSSLTENDTLPSISSGNLKKVEVTQNGKTTTYKKRKNGPNWQADGEPSHLPSVQIIM